MKEPKTQEEFEQKVTHLFNSILKELSNENVKMWDEFKKVAQIVKVKRNATKAYYLLDIIPNNKSLSKISLATNTVNYTMLNLRDLGLCEIKNNYIYFNDKFKTNLLK